MAKKLKIKLPKRVAGVKIPKSVRKGPIGGFLNSSAGQLIMAQALVAAGGAFAVKRSDPTSAIGDVVRHPIDNLKHAARRSGEATLDAKGRTAAQGARLAFAFNEAVMAFRAAMQREDWEAAANRAGAGKRLDTEGEPASKKKQSPLPSVPH